MNICLVGEGRTDHMVLENILTGYFDDMEGEKLHFIYRPEIGDKTYQMAREQFGGWYKVLEYCGSEAFVDGILLQEVDYYIIQIDTDVAHEKEFLDQDISQHVVEAQIELVVEKLIEKINKEDADFYKKYQDKFIFAIAVNELECWLLPLVFNKDKKTASKTNNCLDKLNAYLRKDKKRPLNKQPSRYDKLSRDFCKNKKLKGYCEKNPSLAIFYNTLEVAFPNPI